MNTQENSNGYPREVIVPEFPGNEARTWKVFFLTASMMLLEIVAGTITGSMALLADGWHMATHSAAFGITLFAYRYTNKNLTNKSFAFGPGKANTLGGFASAIALATVAVFMIMESIERFLNPVEIRFNEAIIVAILGLSVNIVSALLLIDRHDHSDGSQPHHHDHNLRSAYFHVLADALTSLLAIVALVLGKYLGWSFMDPVMGIVGAMVILRWSGGLLKDSSVVLLDKAADGEMEKAIRATWGDDPKTEIKHLYVWYLSPNKYAVSIHFSEDLETDLEKKLRTIPDLGYVALVRIV